MARPVNTNCHDIRDVRRAISDINSVLNELVAVSFADIGAIGNPDGYIAIFDGATGTQIIQSGSKVDAAGNFTEVGGINGLAIPSTNFVGVDDVQTLTNKTLTSPTIANFTNAAHDHLDADDGGTLDTAAIASGTFTVARGGTGAASFTDGGVLVGNGTGSVQVTAVGTAGHVLTSNGAGSDPTFQAAAGGISDGDKGDITVSGSGSTLTIDPGVVTLAKMADLAQDQFIGRTTASTGVPETATITAAARTVLDDTTVAAMVDTLGGASALGTGGIVRGTSPTLTTPNIGTPSAGVLTNCTGLPIAGGGTGATTAAGARANLGLTECARVVAWSTPSTVPATTQIRLGGTTIVENIPCYDFSSGADSYVDLVVLILPTYNGGGISVDFHWCSASATSGNFKLDGAFRDFPYADSSNQFSDSHTYSYQSVTDTPSVALAVETATIAFTNAQVDSVAAGHFCLLRLKRDVSVASNMSGIGSVLHTIFIRET